MNLISNWYTEVQMYSRSNIKFDNCTFINIKTLQPTNTTW